MTKYEWDKLDADKIKEALRTIRKMLEWLDEFEKEWNTKPRTDDVQSLDNTLFSQQKTWLNHIKSDLT